MQLVNQNLFHIVFSANSEKKFLTRVNQDILYNYIHGMLFNMKCKPVLVTGNNQHIHVVIEINLEISLGQIVREIQQNTIDFLRREKSVFPEFNGWETNFIVLSYHYSQKENLITSLSNQFDYHRRISFEEELELLLSHSVFSE
ncbi:MAG: transposase [Bacteroidales bacterium]|nr:transposase [Bacteroidales bacterium]MBN2818822.1 transposase [Bacteroidales bacterium]